MNDKERPYALHTNRELAMMLAGAKPLAVFAHEKVDGFEKSDALANQGFAPYVAAGTFSEHVRTRTISLPSGTGVDIDYRFYTLRGEEWRVEAYWLLIDSPHRQAGARNSNGCRGSCSGTPIRRTSAIFCGDIRRTRGLPRFASQGTENQSMP